MDHTSRINLIVGLLFLGLGLMAVFVLIPVGIDEPPSVDFAALSPSYWPRIVCLFIAGFGVLIIAGVLLSWRGGGTDDTHPEATPVPVESTPLRTLTALVLMFVLYAALEPLGFVLATVLALVVLMLLAGERRSLVIGPVALGVPLALYVFFVYAASIPIPMGMLEPLIAGG